MLLLVAMVTRAQERAQGLPAVISISASSLEAGAVKRAVEAELRVPLVIEPTSAQRLEIVVTGRRANVTYVTPGRDPVTRSVDLPKDEARALETLAFLVGNLARDEAGELLAQLRPAEEGPAEVPPPPPPPPPPGEAKPAAAAPPPIPAPPPAPTATAPKLLTSPRFAANVSLFHPATARKHTEQWRLNLELGVAYSRVGALNGAGMNLGYLRVDQSVDGFAGSIFWTRTGGEVRGIVGSVFVAEGYGRLKGIGYATFANLHPGNVEGLQASAFVTTAGDVLGIEGAAFVTLGRDVQGFQGSAGVTVGRDVRGAQLGLIAVGRDLLGAQLNLVGVARDLQGAQLGLVNLARDERGVQAGLVNVGRRVNGLQVGLVNVAEEIHGGAIGLVNVAGNGRFQPVAWFAGPGAMLNAGYKSVTDLTYTQGGVGYDLASNDYRYELGAGLHLALPYRCYAETGLGYAAAYSSKNGDEIRQEGRYDLRVGMEPVRGVTPFIGGTLTRRVSGGGADYRGEYAFGVSFL
jgi:hypothetical protein